MADKNTKVVNQSDGMFGFVFFLAFIGAAVYFVKQSTGMLVFLLAILKAFVWPAYVTYELLKLLGV
jgi:hypothetical protein